jgi:hypothetical protein
MPEFQPMAQQATTDPMVNAYLVCAEWCGLSEEDSEALELSVSPKWDQEAIKHADHICFDFLGEFQPKLSSLEDDSCREQAGYDLWLTRNRHGAGFWDGDWPEPFATEATVRSRTYGSAYAWFDAESETLYIEEG